MHCYGPGNEGARSMIKINLLPSKKSAGLPVVLGMDLNLVNFKLLLVAMLLNALPGFIKDYWNGEIKTVNEELQAKNNELAALNVKLGGEDSIQKMIDAFTIQETKLKERLGVVKTILKTKKNPSKILYYIAQNIPDDLWLTSVQLNDVNISIKGESISYKSIGLFIENLKNSIFFDKSIRLASSQTKKDNESGKRTEEFEISGIITKFF